MKRREILGLVKGTGYPIDGLYLTFRDTNDGYFCLYDWNKEDYDYVMITLHEAGVDSYYASSKEIPVGRYDDTEDEELYLKPEYIEVTKEWIVTDNHRFEVVDFIPSGYQVWNIPDIADDYIPLCQLVSPNSYNVNVETLKAIKTDGVEAIHRAASFGVDTLEKAKLCIQKYQNAKPGTMNYETYQRATQALPFLQKLNWK